MSATVPTPEQSKTSEVGSGTAVTWTVPPLFPVDIQVKTGVGGEFNGDVGPT